MANVAREGLVQSSSFRFQPSNLYVDASGTQLLKTSPAHLGVGIRHGSHYTTNPGGDQSVSARGRAALVRVWFEINVQRSPASLAPSALERAHLSVLYAVVGVDSRPHDAASPVDDDRTNVGIGRRQSDALAR